MLQFCLQCWDDVDITVWIPGEPPRNLDEKTGVVLLISGCLGQGIDVPPRIQTPVLSAVTVPQQTSADFPTNERRISPTPCNSVHFPQTPHLTRYDHVLLTGHQI